MLRLLRKIFNIASDNDAAFVTRIPASQYADNNVGHRHHAFCCHQMKIELEPYRCSRLKHTIIMKS